MEQRVKKVVIAGGGTAGWCAAAALSKLLGRRLDITLVESDAIGIIGVGEATVRTILTFHQLLGINEPEFMKATNASVKLGIGFHNWGRQGDYYFHAFGIHGRSTWLAEFHHVWLQAREEGLVGPLSDYCAEWKAAELGRFATSKNPTLNYAYHFDTSLYGKYLRRMSEGWGVRRVEGKIASISQHPESGNIAALRLESGEVIEGDLFIDCTGLRGLLIEQTLKTGYDDWTHWLANDSALACHSDVVGRLNPYTEAIAHGDGWRWRIALQNRMGNGFVYSSKTLADDKAMDRFLAQIEAPPYKDPYLIRFRSGQRRKVWNKNCIAFGLASGFIEPLESTNIHLMQSGVSRLVNLFPFGGISDAVISHFNRATREEVENIRDFVIMHYKLTERDDSEFWRSRRDMQVPDSLAERLALWREDGHAYQLPNEVFRVDSWVQVMLGQRFEPKRWHHFARMMTREQKVSALAGLKARVDHTVAALPPTRTFLDAYCAEA